MKILIDGSMEGESFSGDNYKGKYPSPKDGETYAKYRKRVDEAKKEGFHLGDLNWNDWDIYCRGSGTFEGFDSDQVIE